MSINEINPGNGLETGVDSSTGLPGSISDINRDLFGQPLSEAPSALGSIPNPLLESDDGFDTGASHDSSINAAQTKARSDASFVYGDEFESGILPIDLAAQQVGKVLNFVDKTVEESTLGVRQFISETATQLSEATHDGIDTARRNWNAPDNELREALTDRIQRGVGFFKKWAANLSENGDARELMDNAITVGRNLAEKTGDVIQNAQVATESWLDRAYNETYSGDFLPSGQLSGSDRLDQPFVGVIDTGFNAQAHGTQVTKVIQQVGHQFPDWLADSVGSGTWSESLVNFVDAAKASERSNAVINLSFDLTQINPDGSVSTRFELTAAEREALKYAQANGVLVVVSAGNQSGAMSALGQASQDFDNVIAVGATEGGQRADYSSYGEGLDFVASGQGEAEVEGTSLAAARMTGSIAQIWDANPQLDYRQVIQTLESTATDLQQSGWDHETGFGRLNPSAAIALAEDLAAQPQGFANSPTSQNPVQGDQADQDLHNVIVERESSAWQELNGAIPSERPNRVIEGTGTGPIPAEREPSKYQGMSADAAEHWAKAEQNRESEPSKYQGMSADAAEHWAKTAPAPAPIAPSVPDILKYERGAPLTHDPAVAQWQQRMKDQGYDITVDGLYGSQSEQIARQFQQEQGLTVDGIVGSDTWNATFSNDASEPSPLQPVSIAAIDHSTEAAAPTEPSPQYEPHDLPRNPDAAEVWLTPPDQKDELLERRATIFSDGVEQKPPISPDGSSHREMGITLHEATTPPPLNPRDIPLGILRAEGLTYSDFLPSPPPAPAVPNESGWFSRFTDSVSEAAERTSDSINAIGDSVSDGLETVDNWVESNGSTISEIGHTALDVAGLVPVLGAVPDLINAGWYWAEGRETDAALSAFGAIPLAGDAAVATRLAARYGDDVIQGVAPRVDELFRGLGHAQDVAGVPDAAIGSVQGASDAVGHFAQGDYLQGGQSLINSSLSALGVRSGVDSSPRTPSNSVDDGDRPPSHRLSDALIEPSHNPDLTTSSSTFTPRSDDAPIEPSHSPDPITSSSTPPRPSDAAIESPPNPEPTVSLSPEPHSSNPAIEPSHSPDPITSSSTPPRPSDAAIELSHTPEVTASSDLYSSFETEIAPRGFVLADAEYVGRRITEHRQSTEREHPFERLGNYDVATETFTFNPRLGIDHIAVHETRPVVWRPEGEAGDVWTSIYRDRGGVTTADSNITRSHFRDEASQVMGERITEYRQRTGEAHPFEQLGHYDEATGSFRLNGDLHAGHITTAHRGGPDMLAIEHRSFNLGRDGSTREGNGEILRRRVVEIDGVPFELRTARLLFPDLLIGNAPSHPGWRGGDRIIDSVRRITGIDTLMQNLPD